MSSSRNSLGATSLNEIKLLGQRIVLKASDKNPEFVQEVLSLVSGRLAEAEERGKANSNSAPHQVTLIALLDLAEEYVKAKKRVMEYQVQLDHASEQLLKLVGADLSE